jgi:ABC-2 type transport system permease protein
VMVVLFANLRAGRTPAWILFPSAVAYTLMGIAPLCYNALGLEAAGIQFYFLAPVKMRDVFLAKNLMNLGLAAIEIIAVFAAITYVAHAPSLSMTLTVLLWAAFTMFVTLTVGNRRSITAPKKIDVAKMNKNQAAPLSALISIGLLLVCAALGGALIAGAHYLDKMWVPVPVMLVLAAIGFFAYMNSLGTLDEVLAEHRDTLSETLCKT